MAMVVLLQETLNGQTNDLSTTPAPSEPAVDDGAAVAAAWSDAFLVASSAWVKGGGGGVLVRAVPQAPLLCAFPGHEPRTHLQGLHFSSQRCDVHSDTGEASPVPRHHSARAPMEYRTSTQRSAWVFTSDSLAVARARVLEVLASRQGASGAPAPTVRDLLLLQRYYTVKAKEVATALQLPSKVFRTCSLLLARCCLDPAVVGSFDFRAVMLTCLYVASKAEERYVSADTLAVSVGGPGAATGSGSCSAQGVLVAEVPVLKACGFSLVTHHAHRSALGFVRAASEVPDAPPAGQGGKEGSVERLQERALARCDALLLASDAPLLFSPGALGLAAVVHAARGTAWEAAAGAVAGQVTAVHGPDVLHHALAAVQSAVAAVPLDSEAVRTADRVWKTWRAAMAQAGRAAAGGGVAGGAKAGEEEEEEEDGGAMTPPPQADAVPVPSSKHGAEREGGVSLADDGPEPKRRRSETPVKDATPRPGGT